MLTRAFKVLSTFFSALALGPCREAIADFQALASFPGRLKEPANPSMVVNNSTLPA